MNAVFSQGSHRVADILSLTAGLSQEELLTVQRSISERCQHSAEVRVYMYIHVYINVGSC